MLFAEYEGDEVWASEFPNELADINTCSDSLEKHPHCPECGERVTHHSESINGRAAHFAHCRSGGGGSGGGGGGGCGGATVGESQEHKAMKSLATSAIEFALDDLGVEETYLEVGLDAPHSADVDKREADCLIEFEERDEQLGEGLIIEVQYKNKNKDKTAVTLDYLNLDEDYSVLWLWSDDFHTSADLPKDWSCKLVHEEMVRQRVSSQIWPPKKSVVDFHGNWHNLQRNLIGLLGSAEVSEPEVTEYIRKVQKSSLKAGVAPRFECVASDMWEQTPMRELLKPSQTDGYIQEVRESLENRRVPVTILDSWLTFKKRRQISGEDKRRIRRGASVSVSVGPCPECGYEWKTHPQSEAAKCPNCASAGVGSENGDIPVVDVNADRSETVVDTHEYRARARSNGGRA